MPVITKSISLSTRGSADMVDITDQVELAMVESNLQSGIVTIFTPSSTSGLTTIEYESGALSDLKRLFDEIVPQNKVFAHNEAWNVGI